jgi:hypothetical protein
MPNNSSQPYMRVNDSSHQQHHPHACPYWHHFHYMCEHHPARVENVAGVDSVVGADGGGDADAGAEEVGNRNQ